MKKILTGLCLCCLLLLCSLSYAGQALYVNSGGVPNYWQASAADPITVNPESGACGQFSNAEMVARLETNLEEWTTITYVDLGFAIHEGDLGSVDSTNYMNYTVDLTGNDLTGEVTDDTDDDSSENIMDGLNPVIFDDDGEIVEAIAGSGMQTLVLGFAGPSGFALNGAGTDYLYIIDGQAVFNCYCLDDGTGSPEHDACGSVVFTVDDLDFTMIHEMGHFLNLDHSQLNLDFVLDSETDNDEYIPAMFPASYNAEKQKTPMSDDIMALSALYPASSFDTTFCKVTGTLLDRFGEEMRCADVQAISTDDSKNVAFVSGSYAEATDNDSDGYADAYDECESDCGQFELYLEPGVAYTLKVASINASFTGGSSVGPCATAQLTTCTAALIAKCTDDDTDTACVACVEDEALSSNDDGDTIASTITAQCEAGETISLGEVTTDSVSKVSAECYESGGCSGGGGGGGGSSSSSSGCSLQTQPSSDFSALFSGLWLCFFGIMALLSGKRLITGMYPKARIR